MQRKDNTTVTLNPRQRLGQMLVEEGLIRPDQLQEALAKQQETGQFIGKVLIELAYIAEQELVAFLVRQCKIPHLNLLDYEIKKEVLDLVPYEMCREHGVLPVDKLGSILTVAMMDPFDNGVLEKIRDRTGLKVKPVLSNWYDFELVFSRLFGAGRTKTKQDAHTAKQSERPLQVRATGRGPSTVEEETDKKNNVLETVDIEEQGAPPEVEEADKDREVGVPLEGHKEVPRIARAPRAEKLKDTDDELPIPEYTFENFLVGQVNTFTYAIARAVADAPGTEYNPLFIYGDVGLGKTHLICAIGNEVLRTQPEKRVIYTSAGTFSTQLVEAIQRHDLVSFREHYTNRDVVIMDDAQFLAGREKTQEEFFDIFNAFHEEHKQIVIASDKPPAELVALEKRMVSRFAGGIVAGVASPEWETRMAILKYQAEMAECEIPEEVLSLVATRVPDDVRKLLGALHKIVAFCELVQQDMSSDLAQEVLDHLFEKKRRAKA